MSAQKQAAETNREGRFAGVSACTILAITAASALVWSHLKLFWVDELLEFYSDTRPTMHAVVAGQMKYPFSLEPPAYHLLLHGMHWLLPAHPELASRLPSVLALLVTQVCVFQLAHKLGASVRAALLACTLPLALATFDFAAEARVYSLLTALFAVAFCAYVRVKEESSAPRAGALLLLFSSSAAAVLVHWYGLFLPLPFVVAECVFSLRSRRVDWPTVSVLLAGLAVFALNAPFLHGLVEIRAHYYSGTEAEAGWSMIPITYMWLFTQYSMYENSGYGHFLRLVAYGSAFVVLPVSCALMLLRQRMLTTRIKPELLTALALGVLLPVLNIIAGHYRTHAYVMRYSVPAVVPLSVVIALCLEPLLSSFAVFVALEVVLLGFGCTQAVHDIQHDRQIRDRSLQEITTTADLRVAQAGTADKHVYIQDVAKFLTTFYYAAPADQATIVGIESIPRERHWLGRDPPSQFLRNMHCSTSLPVSSLEQLRADGSGHLLVVYDDPKEEWIGMELNDRTRVSKVETLGKAFGGHLLRVVFLPHPEERDAESWNCKNGVVR